MKRKPIKIGDRVTIFDRSYSCYMDNSPIDSSDNGEYIVLAIGINSCNLPVVNWQTDIDFHNDTILHSITDNKIIYISSKFIKKAKKVWKSGVQFMVGDKLVRITNKTDMYYLVEVNYSYRLHSDRKIIKSNELNDRDILYLAGVNDIETLEEV